MGPEGTSPETGFATRLLRRLKAALGGVCATPGIGSIAAGLARGLALREAKDYLHYSALVRRIGQGRGPVHHFHRWWRA